MTKKKQPESEFPKSFKELCACIAMFGIVILLFLNVAGFVVGAADQESICLNKPIRLAYVMPAYKAACYLFSNDETWWWRQTEKDLGGPKIKIENLHDYSFNSPKDKKNLEDFAIGWANAKYATEYYFRGEALIGESNPTSCDTKGGSKSHSGFQIFFTVDGRIIARHTCVHYTSNESEVKNGDK